LSEKARPPQRSSWLDGIRRSRSGRGAGEQPAVPVKVEVSTRGWHLIGETGPQDAVLEKVADAVRHDLHALGIPGQPEVVLEPVPGASDDLRLRVHGRLCRVPAEHVAEILRRLAGQECPSVFELPPEHIGSGVAGFCTAAMHRRPSTLLGDEQLRCYRDTLGRVSTVRPDLVWPPAGQRLREVLAPVLDVGVSIGSINDVSAIVGAGELDAVPSGLLAERLIDQLRLAAVHILLDGQTLRWLTTQDPEPTDAFVRLREELYAESGAVFPDFVFSESAGSPPGTVMFGLNSLLTPPIRLPDHHPLQAVVACLRSALRAHRGWFFCTSVLQDRLEQLRFACPDLVGAIEDRYPAEWLSSVGRALFREEVPTPRLKTILEHVLDLGPGDDAVDVVRFSESAATYARPTTGSLPEPRDVVCYLRQRSNEQLEETVLIAQYGTVLMLGDEVQGMAADLMARGDHPDEQQSEIIVDAVGHQIGGTAGKVCLAVPSVPMRSLVRELLEPEFPLVPVVATQELGTLGAGLLGEDHGTTLGRG
jgi:hypothetical protein